MFVRRPGQVGCLYTQTDSLEGSTREPTRITGEGAESALLQYLDHCPAAYRRHAVLPCLFTNNHAGLGRDRLEDNSTQRTNSETRVESRVAGLLSLPFLLFLAVVSFWPEFPLLLSLPRGF